MMSLVLCCVYLGRYIFNIKILDLYATQPVYLWCIGDYQVVVKTHCFAFYLKFDICIKMNVRTYLYEVTFQFNFIKKSFFFYFFFYLFLWLPLGRYLKNQVIEQEQDKIKSSAIFCLLKYR